MSAVVRVGAVFFSLVLGVGVGTGAYIFVAKRGKLGGPTKATTTDDTAAPARPSASADARVVASASATPTVASPTPSANASASSSAGEMNPTTCVATLFAEGTFLVPVELAAVCDDKTVADTVRRMKEAIVKGGAGHVTVGMQEWASAGIHDMALAAILRGRCCPTSPPLESPKSPGTCAPVDDVLREIERAARSDVPDSEIDAVVAHFDSVARCIVRSGDTSAFGGYVTIDGGETTIFMKFLRRAQHGPDTNP